MIVALADARAAVAGASVVVTGATGFVGSRLVRELLAAGARVTALSRSLEPEPWRLAGVAGDLSWARVQYVSPSSLRAALEHAQPRYVFHLAALIDMGPDADAAALDAVNVTAAVDLVEACAELSDLRLFVQTGSCAEYGDIREPATEDTPLHPNTPYGASKARATEATLATAEKFGLPLTVLRPYNLYGEYEAKTRLTPHVALSLLAGRTVSLTAAEQVKDYHYVGDLAEAYLAAAANAPSAEGRVFNIGSGRGVTLRAFIETIADSLGADRELLAFGAQPYRENEMWHQTARIDSARELLGWEPTHRLEQGVAVTAAWYKENRALYE